MNRIVSIKDDVVIGDHYISDSPGVSVAYEPGSTQLRVSIGDPVKVGWLHANGVFTAPPPPEE